MRRAFRSPTTRLLAQVGFVAMLAWTVLSAPTSWAVIKAEAVTLEYQVQNSDVIVRGTCVDTATTFSNRHFVTTYKIAVRKYLKAPGKMSVETHPVILVSQVGGRVSRPIPIEESSPETAVIYAGEDVVLFLRSPESIPAAIRTNYQKHVAEGRLQPSPLMTNYQLTTAYISKLSVIRDRKTGAEMVTRLNLDRYGILPSEEAQRKYVEALQSNQNTIAVKSGGQTLLIPVEAGKPASEPSAGQASTVEDKIRQMQRFTTSWDGFQRQVESILRGEKTAAPLPAGAAQPAQPTRTIQPRKEQ